MTSNTQKPTEGKKITRREVAWIGAAAVLSLLLGLGLANWLDGGAGGVLPKYPGLGGDFNLESAQGPVSLKDFRDQVVVMYIGYASCPDVCPTSLATIVAAIQQLKPEQRSQIQPIFISVDPQRDTPELLAQYVQAFDPNMLGLTGSKQQIDTVTGQYKAFYALVPQQGTAGEYAVDHTSATYVIGRNGELREILGHGVSAETLAVELRKALGD